MVSSAVVNEPKPFLSSKRVASVLIPFKKTYAPQLVEEGSHENKYFVFGFTAILIDCGADGFHPFVYPLGSVVVIANDFSL